MKILRLLNTIIISVVAIVSIYLCKFDLEIKNVYDLLIKLLVIPIILLPKILRGFKIKIYDSEEFVYIMFVFLAYFLGSIIDLYHKISFYDTLMHFTSGILSSLLALDILKRENVIEKNNLFITLLFVLGFTFLISGLWEIFEFTTDKLFNKDAQNVFTTGVNDTMKDIICAFLACLFILLSYAYEKINNKKIMVINFIKSIG